MSILFDWFKLGAFVDSDAVLNKYETTLVIKM